MAKAKAKIPGIESGKCEKRNRIAAQRENVEGAPVRFLLRAQETDFSPTERAGRWPEDEDEAMAMINARLPEGAEALSREDVFIHFVEAANDSFIGDRFAFLGESTLRNIAANAEAGVAFMNSHRTGSFSTESELPFGRTFAGQYQEEVDESGRRCRPMIGMYMLRGIRPNGEGGPTTDDLDRMIRGGQVQDVSVGLSKGEAICDVCSRDLKECDHYPGTRRDMSDEQIEAQIQRGVPGGRASYTIENAELSEVSAVYDGAVPGAGIKKVLSARNKLSAAEWAEARESFGSLLGKEVDWPMAGINPSGVFEQIEGAVERGVRSALQQQGEAQASSKTKGDGGMAEDPQGRRLEELEARLAAQAQQIEGLSTAKNEAEGAAMLAEQRAAAAAERIQKLETEARRARFEREVAGDNNSDVAWFGNQEEHVRFLMDLADKFGEKSDQMKFYVERERAIANQLESSALFRETGSSAASEGASAWDQLEAKGREIQAQDKTLSREQAIAMAQVQNPRLYDQYLAEGGN